MEYLDEEELMAMITINSCNEAIEFWNPDWSRCPCCLATYDLDGYVTHKLRVIH